MQRESIIIDGKTIPVYRLDTVIIGSGCAGFNAADWLYDLGRRDIAILTEGVNMGTSRNTGSDKQTYYKLSLASDGSDSVFEMAQTLFQGGGVNGDTAMIEAACSVRSFMKLVNLGVPFPTNRFGEYVGYKTDHDPRQRATSAGPLTSKYMTECLERSVRRKKISIFDGMQAIRLFTSEGRLTGVLAIDLHRAGEDSYGFTLFQVSHVILATGGPAGIYDASVYPESQTGMSGMAIEAGAKASNLQEWQYGLASTKFRWNVSGTYQQVLPRYIAVDRDGQEREFLPEYFENPQKALNMVFLKGYQWPFDFAKLHGSSMIDMIVHHEVCHKGNRVFMDFRNNPQGLENGFFGLSEETYTYLKKSDALLSTPIERLEKMNREAIRLYQNNGIDLWKESLEINVCAQHCNGGIAVDENWESSVGGLYVVGEAAGTFGVYRPGGSALNSAQVGSMRAAEHIAFETDQGYASFFGFIDRVTGEVGQLYDHLSGVFGESNILEIRRYYQKQMSACCAFMRDSREIGRLRKETTDLLHEFYSREKITSRYEIPHLFKNRDALITQGAVLSAAWESINHVGSRGSSVIIDPDGEGVGEKLPQYRYRKQKSSCADKLIVTGMKNGGYQSELKPVRSLQKGDDWFETVWNTYIKRTGKVLDQNE